MTDEQHSEERLEPCPWCKAVPAPMRPEDLPPGFIRDGAEKDWQKISHAATCFIAMLGFHNYPIHRERWQTWNSRASVAAPQGDVNLGAEIMKEVTRYNDGNGCTRRQLVDNILILISQSHAAPSVTAPVNNPNNDRCHVSVTGRHSVDPPYCKDCGQEFPFAPTSTTPVDGEQEAFCPCVCHALIKHCQRCKGKPCRSFSISEGERQRDLLAKAIVEAATKAGIIDGLQSITGPQLLMLCDDLATAATTPTAASSEGEHTHCWHTRIDAASYCCHCEDLEDVAHAAPPSTPQAIRAAAREWMDTWHGAFATNKEREDALVAILSRCFGKGEPESVRTAAFREAIAVIVGLPTEHYIYSGPYRMEASTFRDNAVEALEAALVVGRSKSVAPGSSSPAEPLDKCAWILDDSNDGDLWETGCGESFRFTDGGPTDNGFVFCYKCGRRIDAARYSDFASVGRRIKMSQTRCDLYGHSWSYWKEGGKSYMKCDYCGAVRPATVADAKTTTKEPAPKPIAPFDYDMDDSWGLGG